MPSSVTIDVSSPRRERGQRLRDWLYRQFGPRTRDLPSYQRARDELGGLPWRRLEQTESWFLQSAATLRAHDDEDLSEPGVGPSVPRGTLRPVLSQRARLAVAGAVGLSLVVVLMLARSPATAPVVSLPRISAPVAALVPSIVPAPQLKTGAVHAPLGARSAHKHVAPARVLKRHGKKSRHGVAAGKAGHRVEVGLPRATQVTAPRRPRVEGA